MLTALGVGRLELLLPEILARTKSKRSFVREGFMSLLVYLPAAFGEKYLPYMQKTIFHVLRGLADDSAPVRDAAMRACKLIVSKFFRSAMNLLLPELENGLFDSVWRVRLSSVTLLGELLFKLGNINKLQAVDLEQDADIGTETGRKAIIASLGQERYESMLASLYVIRSDVNG